MQAYTLLRSTMILYNAAVLPQNMFGLSAEANVGNIKVLSLHQAIAVFLSLKRCINSHERVTRLIDLCCWVGCHPFMGVFSTEWIQF